MAETPHYDRFRIQGHEISDGSHYQAPGKIFTYRFHATRDGQPNSTQTDGWKQNSNQRVVNHPPKDSHENKKALACTLTCSTRQRGFLRRVIKNL